MIAEIVGVGTELLLGEIVNSNAQYLSQRLAELGIDVYYHTVVGDNQARLVSTLRQALDRSDVVITTGGLGPTADDLTREAVAAVLGRSLVFDDGVWRGIEAWFTSRGRTTTPNNRRQAFVIDGSTVLPNPNGTAPGLLVEAEGKVVVLLPGPPVELRTIYETHVMQFLRTRSGGRSVIHSRVVKICLLGESVVEERLRDIMEVGTNPTVAPYASPGEVHLRITSKAESVAVARSLIEPVEAEIRSRLGEYVFGVDDETLESAVGSRLRALQLTIGTGESCTGGLLGHRLTQVPGSSAYYLGGSVAYSNKMKVDTLGVRESTLSEFGAVSEGTALEMASGARRLTGADIGVGTTGIAGPSGGTEGKPVGTVHVAISGPAGDVHKRLSLWGSRDMIKWRTSQDALAMVWRYLSEMEPR